MRAPITGTYYHSYSIDDTAIITAVDLDGEEWTIIVPPGYIWISPGGLVMCAGDLLPLESHESFEAISGEPYPYKIAA